MGAIVVWLVALCLLPDPRPMGAPEWAVQTVNQLFNVSESTSRLVATVVLRIVGVGMIGVLLAVALRPLKLSFAAPLARIFHQRVLSLDFLGDCHRIAKNSAGSRFLTQRPLSPKLSHAWFRLSEGQPVSGISREESVWNNA